MSIVGLSWIIKLYYYHKISVESKGKHWEKTCKSFVNLPKYSWIYAGCKYTPKMAAADECDWSRKVNKVREILTKPGGENARIFLRARAGK
jgi:hypothetical protein